MYGIPPQIVDQVISVLLVMLGLMVVGWLLK